MTKRLENPPASLQDCEVLFLDFLGFSDAVREWPPKKLEELIGLLVEIAKGQSTFNVEGKSQADGSFKITLQANVTTFSDNIVVSHPLVAKPDFIEPEIWPVIENIWQSAVREQMQIIAAQVAIAGLDNGLLVRGGLSRGKLYHHGAVVVGEGMIDAYELERNVASGSRIVVSDRVADDYRLYVDAADGRRCLEILTPIMLAAGNRYGDGKTWARGILKMADQTIPLLIAAGKVGPAEKWRQFRELFAGAEAAI